MRYFQYIFYSIILSVFIVLLIRKLYLKKKKLLGGSKYESCNKKSLSLNQKNNEIYYIYSGKIYKKEMSYFDDKKFGSGSNQKSLSDFINSDRDILHHYNFPENSIKELLNLEDGNLTFDTQKDKLINEIKKIIDDLEEEQSIENLCINNFKL